MRTCVRRFLGRIDYVEATTLQDRIARGLKDRCPEALEQLLLLEHPPVITMGRNAKDDDVLIDPATLRALGVGLARTDRGGQVTYHGPGQLVGYPILDLHPDRRDVARYLRDLEEVLIRTLACFGIEARRSPGLTGVWVGEEKIAAIGVHLSRWVTTHGFALNVETELSHFDLIVPCGLRSRGVTSMRRVLGRPVPLVEVAGALAPEFAAVFERHLIDDEASGEDAASRSAGPH